MRKFFLMITVAFSFMALNAQESEAWMVKMDAAKELARDSEKSILISFSGSDWCGNCMRLSKELFETEEFLAFAESELILLNLDFPAKKANKLSDELTAQNDKLAEIYNKQGVFPLTLLVDERGKLLGKVTYPCASVEEYLQSITALIQ
ncbi:MAG: thioredoxin-related protein [Chitinophagales bacterium]|jgi:thioredoxin-related protein